MSKNTSKTPFTLAVVQALDVYSTVLAEHRIIIRLHGKLHKLPATYTLASS